MTIFLSGEGYTVSTFSEGLRSYETVRDQPPDCLIMDLHLAPPDDGWQLLERLEREPWFGATLKVVCSADVHLLRKHDDDLHRRGCHLLPKPFHLSTLLTLLEQPDGEQPAACSPDSSP
jgi:CheY-like chemotaxis protein